TMSSSRVTRTRRARATASTAKELMRLPSSRPVRRRRHVDEGRDGAPVAGGRGDAEQALGPLRQLRRAEPLRRVQVEEPPLQREALARRPETLEPVRVRANRRRLEEEDVHALVIRARLREGIAG